MVVDILWCVVALFLWCGGGHFVVCSCTVYMVWWWTFCCGVYLYCFYGVVVDMLWCVDVLCFYGVVVDILLWCVVALFIWCGGGHFVVVCTCTVSMVWWWTCCGV